MSINIDIKPFESLSEHFFTISSVHLVLYDDEFNLIYKPPKMCNFCEEVWKCPKLKKQCTHSNNQALLKCKQSKQPYIYSCHMGLWEVATPIVENDFVIGYVIFGQILKENDTQDVLKRLEIIKDLQGLNYEIMIRDLKTKHPATINYINSLAQILKACTSYILINSIVTVKEQTTIYIINHYIDEHISQDLSINSICSEFGISRSTLYKATSTHFGCGISQLIKNKRMEKAKELLASTSKPIAEITELIGISDAPYFNKCFRKHEHMTPSQYRNIHKTM